MGKPNPKIATFLGMTNVGKSFALGYTMARIARPFVVIVSTDEDESLMEHIERKRTMIATVSRPAKRPTAAMLSDLQARGFRYLYFVLDRMSSRDIVEFVTQLTDAIAELGDMALVVDEAHKLFCAGSVPDELEAFIRSCRRRGVDILFGTHGYKDIDYRVRKVMQQLVIFRTADDNDLKALGDDLKLGRELVERVRALLPHHYIFVNTRTGYVSPAPCKIHMP